MSTKLSLLSRAAAVAALVALALPALAQSNPPAAAPAAGKQTSGEVEKKTDKKVHAAKQDDTHKQTAEKPSPKKTQPSGAVGTDGAKQ